MEPPTLSKSAEKKAARAARLAELKFQRRARERQVKKEKRRVRAEKRAAGELDDDDEAEKARQKKKPKVEFGGRVIVDLGFDHLMSEKVLHCPSGYIVYPAYHDKVLPRRLGPFVLSWPIPTVQIAMLRTPSL